MGYRTHHASARGGVDLNVDRLGFPRLWLADTGALAFDSAVTRLAVATGSRSAVLHNIAKWVGHRACRAA